MKVKEIMERCGMQETGKAIAYIKDGLQELEMLSSENVHSGSRAYLQGTTFSVIASADTGQIANNTAWTDASGATQPASWTKFNTDSGDSVTHSIESGELRLTAADTISILERVGIYQSMTTVIGDTYNLTYNANNVAGTADIQVGVLNATPTNDEGHSAFSAKVIASNTHVVGTVSGEEQTLTFNATGTTTYVYISLGGGSVATSEYADFDNVKLLAADSISDSSNGFVNAGFEVNQKLRISGSSSNNTADTSVSSVGYYTISGVSAGTLSLSDTPVVESAGEKWTLIGAKPNYIDIIVGKRYYALPDDFIKMKDVKIKNHRNNTNKYRTIPRMIHEPIDRDEDDI